MLFLLLPLLLSVLGIGFDIFGSTLNATLHAWADCRHDEGSVCMEEASVFVGTPPISTCSTRACLFHYECIECDRGGFVG